MKKKELHWYVAVPYQRAEKIGKLKQRNELKIGNCNPKMRRHRNSNLGGDEGEDGPGK